MNVYWTILDEQKIDEINKTFSNLNYYEPENVFQSHLKNRKNYFNTMNKNDDYIYCPAFSGHMNNTYSIKFPFDYKLSFEDNNIKTDMYDQSFFNKFVLIRSIDNKFISITLPYLFFSEKSLEFLISSPYFSNNEFTKCNRVIPGKYNIGNWMRRIEIPIITDKENNDINIKKGDDALYVTFLTNKKIKLKKFFATDKIKYLVHNNLSLKNYKKNFSSLDYFYKKFKMSKQKNLILKEIKNNLME